MQHLLSVVIAIKDNTSALIKTLASLAELDKCNASFEVLVMNGGSAFMKEELAQQPYSITIVDEVEEVLISMCPFTIVFPTTLIEVKLLPAAHRIQSPSTRLLLKIMVRLLPLV